MKNYNIFVIVIKINVFKKLLGHLANLKTRVVNSALMTNVELVVEAQSFK